MSAETLARLDAELEAFARDLDVLIDAGMSPRDAIQALANEAKPEQSRPRARVNSGDSRAH
jgi:pilus assembly protein TadC